MKTDKCKICGNPKAYKAKMCDKCYDNEFPKNMRDMSKRFKNAEL